MAIDGHLQRMHETKPLHRTGLGSNSATESPVPLQAPLQQIVNLQRMVGNRAVGQLVAQRRVNTQTGTLMREEAAEELPPLTPIQPVNFTYVPEDAAPAVNHGRVVTLEGETTADFPNSSNSVTVAQTPLQHASGCEGCSETDPCVTVNTTATFTYQVPVHVRLPNLDAMGLNECEREQAQNWVDTVLEPHEQEHVRRFRTYNGTTTHPVSITTCNSQMQTALDERTQDMLATEQTSRQAAAQSLSDEIDPFNFDFEINCPEEDADQDATSDDSSTAE